VRIFSNNFVRELMKRTKRKKRQQKNQKSTQSIVKIGEEILGSKLSSNHGLKFPKLDFPMSKKMFVVLF